MPILVSKENDCKFATRVHRINQELNSFLEKYLKLMNIEDNELVTSSLQAISMAKYTSSLNDEEFKILMSYIKSENDQVIKNIKSAFEEFDGKFDYKNRAPEKNFYKQENFHYLPELGISPTGIAIIVSCVGYKILLGAFLVSLLIVGGAPWLAAIAVAVVATILIVLMAKGIASLYKDIKANREEYLANDNCIHLSYGQYKKVTKAFQELRQELIKDALPKIHVVTEGTIQPSNSPAIILEKNRNGKFISASRISIFKEQPIINLLESTTTVKDAVKSILPLATNNF